MSKRPVAAYDLPARAYPVTMTAHRTSNGEEVWREVIERPPGVLEIPPLAKQVGERVWIRVTWATGEVEEAWP